MFIRKVAVLAAIAALGLLALGAATSSATIVEDPGGGNVATGTHIVNGASDPSTLTVTGLGTVTCSSVTTDFTLTTNDTTTASGDLNTLTFESCTDTLPVIAIGHCQKSGTNVPTVTLNPDSNSIHLTDVTVKCFLVSSATAGCDYTAASATGTVQNTPSKILFSGVNVLHVSGGAGDQGGLCGTGAVFNTTLTNLRTAAGNSVTLLR